MKPLALLLTAALALTLSLVTVPSTLAAAAATCAGRQATIVGTKGPDTLVGTRGNDVIVGLGGTDLIDGGAGDDVICGGDGNDTLRGGPGDDRLFGQRDYLEQNSSSGGAEFVIRYGDILAGGPGDDRLDAGEDLRPGDVSGIGNNDTITFATQAGVRVHLAAVRELGSAVGEGRDVIVGQRALVVLDSPGPDRIWGSPYDDVLTGHQGDALHGRGGDDRIRLVGSRGGMFGGPGRDRLKRRVYVPDAHVVIRGGPDNDNVAYYGAGLDCPDVELGLGRGDRLGLYATDEVPAKAIDVDLARGELQGCGLVASAEIVVVKGDDVRWTVRGTSDADLLRAHGVSLVAHMLRGDDRVLGTEGDDIIVGGPGNDSADGEGGVDDCQVEAATNCE